MISYTLKCSEGHRFESWFQSAAAFDTLKSAGHLSCAVCGTGTVEKAVMAPSVTASRKKAAAPATPATPQPETTRAATPTALPPDMPPEVQSEVRQALQKLKAHVERNSDYVGRDFAKQARDMHLGDAPERAIYGEVNAGEAKSLLEDGIPVLPLPFTPTKKAN